MMRWSRRKSSLSTMAVVVRPRGEGGDSRFSPSSSVPAMPSRRPLLCAASTLRRGVWPLSAPLRVRIAVHTGEVTCVRATTTALPSTGCARLRAVGGHGGQTLVSAGRPGTGSRRPASQALCSMTLARTALQRPRFALSTSSSYMRARHSCRIPGAETLARCAPTQPAHSSATRSSVASRTVAACGGVAAPSECWAGHPHWARRSRQNASRSAGRRRHVGGIP